MPEILDETCGVLAEPDCASALADAIRAAILLDRGACRRRAEAVCDKERMVDAYEAIYRDLCGERARRALPPGHGRAAEPSLLGAD